MLIENYMIYDMSHTVNWCHIRFPHEKLQYSIVELEVEMVYSRVLTVYQ